MKGRMIGRGIVVVIICSLLILFQSSSHVAAVDQYFPGETAQHWVEKKLAKMSLEEKVGQMFIVGFEQSNAANRLDEHVQSLIRHYHVGGIILFDRNIENLDQLGQLTGQMQRTALSTSPRVPLVITIDQEGGSIVRIKEGVTLFPGNMAVGATRDPSLAYEVAQITGKELRALGINMNMAPVLDVNNNPANPVIGVRSFSEDPQLTATLAASTIRGYRDGHILSVGKHFPGHGDTGVDSHIDLPTVPHDRKRLDSMELIPFREAIAQDIDVLMTAHVTFPAIDPTPGLPATLSEPVLTGLLRKELGYTGVIITDDMEMGAIADNFGTKEAAIRAVQAGADMILISHTFSVQQESIEAVLQAVKEGHLSENRIDQSVRRILTMKAEKMGAHSIVSNPVSDPGQIKKSVGLDSSKRKAEEVAERAVTLIRDEGGQLPLTPKEQPRLLVVSPAGAQLLGETLQTQGFDAQWQQIKSNPSEEEIQTIVERAADVDAIIIGTLGAQGYPAQVQLVKKLQHTGKPTVVLGLNTPYDLAAFPSCKTYLALYSTTPVSFQAAAKAVTGQIPLSGELPVRIPGMYPFGGGIKRR